MPRSPWLALIAIGWLAGATDASGQPIPLPDKPQLGEAVDSRNSRSANSDPSAAANNQPSVQASPPQTRIQGRAKPEINDAMADDRKQYPGFEYEDTQECDLAAQQSMAEATHWMNAAAWTGVFLTVIGLGLIAKTMIYTRDAAGYAKDAAAAVKAAVKEAEQTTEAAIVSIEVSKKIGANQLRAYVGVEAIDTPKILTQAADAIIRVKNYGATPANIIRIYPLDTRIVTA